MAGSFAFDAKARATYLSALRATLPGGQRSRNVESRGCGLWGASALSGGSKLIMLHASHMVELCPAGAARWEGAPQPTAALHAVPCHADGTNTTIVSVTRVPHGWQVVTNTVYPDDQQVPLQAYKLCYSYWQQLVCAESVHHTLCLTLRCLLVGPSCKALAALEQRQVYPASSWHPTSPCCFRWRPASSMKRGGNVLSAVHVLPHVRCTHELSPASSPSTNQFQASTLAFARKLLPSRDPLGPAAMGPNRPVFLTEATVTTGNRSAKVFANHVMLLNAHNTGATTGRATAADFPDKGFAQVCGGGGVGDGWGWGWGGRGGAGG